MGSGRTLNPLDLWPVALLLVITLGGGVCVGVIVDAVLGLRDLRRGEIVEE